MNNPVHDQAVVPLPPGGGTATLLKNDGSVSLAVVPARYRSTTGPVSVLMRYLGGGGPVVLCTSIPPVP